MTTVIGIDPGFASMGVCIAEEDPDGRLQVISAEVWATEKDAKLPRHQDNARRLELYGLKLVDLLARNPRALVVLESLALPRGRIQLQVAVGLGRVRGLFDMLRAQGFEVLEVTPQAVKKMITGQNNATKLEVEAVVRIEQPETVKLLDAVTSEKKREHITDAIAVARTGLWLRRAGLAEESKEMPF